MIYIQLRQEWHCGVVAKWGHGLYLEPQSYVQPQRYYPSHKDKVVLSLKLGGAVRGSLECPNYEPQTFRLLSLLAYKNT